MIAKLCRYAKFCENAGYGFDKMLVWKKETNREVHFESRIDMAKVTFMLRDGKVDVSGGQTGQESDRNRAEENQSTENLILEILKNNPSASRSEISKKLENISSGGVSHYLEKMKPNNVIWREGADRGGKWIIINPKTEK